MGFLSEYGLFLAKTLTILLALLAVIVAIAISRRHAGERSPGHLRITNLSQRLQERTADVRAAVADEAEAKQLAKQEKAERKARAKAAKKREATPRSRSYVLDFHGDIRASAVEHLREEISAILLVAQAGEQVILRLESGGGMVHAYGLASSQLKRLRDHGLKLTVAIDKIAASGGYMMACVAERIIAAPFAIIGSIGVVAQVPNINRLLKKHDVDIELHTAGQFKRTLTVLGENTEAGREKFKAELEDTHQLFKHFVSENRPGLAIEDVATGEHWYGSQALEKGLVDAIQTSDDLILETAQAGDVYEVRFIPHKRLSERLGQHVESSLQSALEKFWHGATRRREW